MEFDEVVRKRRSVRKYKKSKVEVEKLMEILDVARLAPSAGNLQPWSFIVVDDEKKKMEISEAAAKQYWMTQATFFVVVCARLEAVERFYGGRGERLYAIQDCAAATQNILLKAISMGISNCWVGAFDESAVSRILKLPDNIRPQAIITIGYSDEEPEMPHRLDLENLVYFNEWGGKREVSFKFLRDKTIKEEKEKGFFEKIFKK